MPRKTEDRLEQLRQLRTSSDPSEVESALRKALAERSNLVVAEAAKIAKELKCTVLIPDLLLAFNRLFDDAAKNDAKCWGKTAIIRTLVAFDFTESEPFVRAAGHIQMEPVYGGQEDTAVHLRANAKLALVQCRDLSRREILRHLVDALADSADTVRIEAVRALEQMNGEEAALVLRLKAHAGDKRPAVIGQVFDSLFVLERDGAVSFVEQFLNGKDDEIRDEAALSIGASRLPSATKVLIKTWKETRNREFGEVLLRALSSSREESALEFLLDLVKSGLSRDSSAALEALALHRDSPEIQSRIELARESRASDLTPD
jgi:hypothetical protein